MSERSSAIIVGASSGIGAALAKDLARSGYVLGLVARRSDALESVAGGIRTPVTLKVLDISDAGAAIQGLENLISEMGGVDLVVITAGVGHDNAGLMWAPEAETIAVNVTGFAAMANGYLFSEVGAYPGGVRSSLGTIGSGERSILMKSLL